MRLTPQFVSTASATTLRQGLALAAFLAATLGPAEQAARGNIIDTTYGAGAGSFELGNYAGGVFDSLAPGSTTIVGWTVGGPGDGIDWLLAPTFRADSGTKSIDMKHLTNSSISTVIPTDIGGLYTLTFGAAAVAGHDNTGTVSAGTLVNQGFTTAFSSSFAGQIFHSFSFQFLATGSSTTITFQATGTLSPPGSEYGPVLDSVSVVAVPEPASMLLLGAGIARFGRRRRRETQG